MIEYVKCPKPRFDALQIGQLILVGAESENDPGLYVVSERQTTGWRLVLVHENEPEVWSAWFMLTAENYDSGSTSYERVEIDKVVLKGVHVGH